MELTLCNFVMVKIIGGTLLFSLINKQNHSQKASPKFFVSNRFGSKSESVSEKKICVV